MAATWPDIVPLYKSMEGVESSRVGGEEGSRLKGSGMGAPRVMTKETGTPCQVEG